MLELTGFPKARNDDQVDALVHLLAWSLERRQDTIVNAGPEIIDVEDDPGYGSSYDDIDPWL